MYICIYTYMYIYIYIYRYYIYSASREDRDVFGLFTSIAPLNRKLESNDDCDKNEISLFNSIFIESWQTSAFVKGVAWLDPKNLKAQTTCPIYICVYAYMYIYVYIENATFTPRGIVDF